MYRSHTCGQLTVKNTNQEVTLAGWVQKSRDKGFMNWIDLRDRYGITQLVFDEGRTEKSVFELAKTLGREFVIQITGTVIERESKNANIPTGEIEIIGRAISKGVTRFFIPSIDSKYTQEIYALENQILRNIGEYVCQ